MLKVSKTIMSRRWGNGEISLPIVCIFIFKVIELLILF